MVSDDDDDWDEAQPAQSARPAAAAAQTRRWHVGARVAAAATLFDEPGSDHAWSRQTYGRHWREAVCVGPMTAVVTTDVPILPVQVRWATAVRVESTGGAV